MKFKWVLRMLLIVMAISPLGLVAQDVFLVSFADKPAMPNWDCREWLSEKAIARRAKHGLPCHDHTDLPLNAHYISSVTEIAGEIRFELRWLNAVSIVANPAQIDQIRQLPFVVGIENLSGMELRMAEMDAKQPDSLQDQMLEGLRRLSRNQMQLDALQAKGLNGKGVRIAVFDAGFKDADTHPAFEKMQENGRILKTWDFQRKTEDVYGFSDHGTAVLSCIGGWMNGQPIGAATEAEFLLARTEKLLSEKPNEEDYWVAAAEWAERNGADIISSSLGYTRRYDWQTDLTGNKTLVTRGAAIAVRKGILVVNSLGNEGQKKKNHLGAPADADSVLAVGATYPMLPYIMPFSSFGPNARGILKPDICAPGYLATAGKKGKFKVSAGTSFSCPLVSGLAACLMQQDPNASHHAIRQQIRESGHLFPYYDYRYGFGVATFQDSVAADTIPCAYTFEMEKDSITLSFSKAENTASDTLNEANTRVLFYHIARPSGELLGYQSTLIRKETEKLTLPVPTNGGLIMRIWFEGCLTEKKLGVE